MLRALRLLSLLATASLVAACGQENAGWSASPSGQTDSVAPSRPTGLVGTAMGSSGASLSWTPATDNVGVASYLVSRNGAQIANPLTTNYVDAGLAPATTYSYSVAAVDGAGNLSPNSASVNVTTAGAADTTAPTQPAGFVAVAANSSLVNLSWNPSTDNVGVTGYIVTRNGTQIATPTATTLADSGLTASTTYTYTVVARDAAGNRSTAASASVTTPVAGDTAAPTQPAGFTAAAASSNRVNLSWSASTDNVGVTGYIVTRNGAQIATPTATTLADTGLTASTTYTYTVVARDAAGNRSTAASASATTPAAVTRTVDLSWDAVTAPNLSGYRVYYGTASRNYTQMLSTGNTTTFPVSGLLSGTRYFFAVSAIDSVGNESGLSNEVFSDIP